MFEKICMAIRLIHALILTAGFAATAFAQTDFWEPVKGPLAGQVLAIAAARNDMVFAGTSVGIGQSTDNGDSWDNVNVGLNATEIRALAINAAGHLFVGAASLTGGVYRSLNNGDNWKAVNAGLTGARVLALGFDSQSRILAGTFANGVFRSVGTTIAVDEDGDAIPSSFALAQNYPNPFWSGATSRSAGNPSTTIAFDLAQPAPVKLKVFDVTGREVAVLADQVFQPGTHKIVFTPNGLADGVYFYRIETGEFAQTRKLTLLK